MELTRHTVQYTMQNFFSRSSAKSSPFPLSGVRLPPIPSVLREPWEYVNSLNRSLGQILSDPPPPVLPLNPKSLPLVVRDTPSPRPSFPLLSSGRTRGLLRVRRMLIQHSGSLAGTQRGHRLAGSPERREEGGEKKALLHFLHCRDGDKIFNALA